MYSAFWATICTILHTLNDKRRLICAGGAACNPDRACVLQLKNAEEAKLHNENTGHSNFEESTEAVSKQRDRLSSVFASFHFQKY